MKLSMVRRISAVALVSFLLAGCGSGTDVAKDAASGSDAGPSAPSGCPGDSSITHLDYLASPASLTTAWLCVTGEPTSEGPNRSRVDLSPSQLRSIIRATGRGKEFCEAHVLDVTLMGRTSAGSTAQVTVHTCGTASLLACSSTPCPTVPVWRPPNTAVRVLEEAVASASH